MPNTALADIRIVPPTHGLEIPDERVPPLDLVRGEPRRGAFRVGLTNSFAFGGNNTVLAFGWVSP